MFTMRKDKQVMAKCSICHKEKGNLILADPQMRCLECISWLIAEKYRKLNSSY